MDGWMKLTSVDILHADGTSSVDDQDLGELVFIQVKVHGELSRGEIWTELLRLTVHPTGPLRLVGRVQSHAVLILSIPAIVTPEESFLWRLRNKHHLD